VRLPVDVRRAAASAALLTALSCVSARWLEGAGTITRADVQRAIDRVKADPNLATEQTIKTLRWKESPQEKQKPPEPPGWFKWIADFFRWLDQSARVLVWVTVIGLVGLLLVYLVRTLGARDADADDASFVAPTHVRDLDIRPETLPPDIGAAARALWDRGDHRAAMALLYRGMLSRLAHVHRIPIRDSSTEGDCLALAASHLAATRHEYATRLVRVWQKFVYGGEEIKDGTVYGLCDGFAAALDTAAALDPAAAGGAA
jgi:hypothetical protein